MKFKQFCESQDHYEEKCPICGGRVVARCRCRVGNKICENQHHWFNKDGVFYEGTGHGPGPYKRIEV